MSNLIAKIWTIGCLKNTYLFLHIIEAIVLFKIIAYFYSDVFALLGTSLVAILWEVYQWIRNKNDVYDAIGDILGAVITCLLLMI